MTIWYVHRTSGGAIQSAHQTIQPGYAEEALDSASSNELQVYLAAAEAVPDLSNSDNLAKTLKAILLAAGALSGKTPAQCKAAFQAAWNALS